MTTLCTPSQVCGLEYPLLPPMTSFYLYSCFAVVVLVFLYGVYRKYSLYGVKPSNLLYVLGRIPTNGRVLLADGLAQKKILQKRFGGLMHSLMFYGIAALVVGTTLVGIDYDILRPMGMILLQGDFYLGFKVALDLFGLALVCGVLLALSRRVSFKPYFLNEDRADRLLLAGMLYLGISGFVQEGLRLALVPVSWAGYAPIGSAFAWLFAHLGATPLSPSSQSWIGLYQVLWWVHALVAFALIASIPYAKYFHVPNAVVNMLVADRDRPAGKLSTPINYAEVMRKMESNPEYVPNLDIGLRTTDDLKWSDRIMLDSCTNCGRCEAACPANFTGRDLSPRQVVQELKARFYEDHRLVNGSEAGPADFFTSGVVRDVEVSSCVTCGACVYECPVDIEQLGFIIDLRRNMVSAGRLDAKQNAVLSNLTSSLNPYGSDNSKRADWARGQGIQTLATNREVEYLLWVGCLGSFNQRSQATVRSLANIMKAAGVSFAILGSEEACTGDPARRLGEEGLYQQLAVQNIKKMNDYRVKKVVTACPHCFNTIKNEYGDLGGHYEVIHHTQLLSDLVRSGRIRPSAPATERAKVTLHDSCYAARHNDISEEPRAVLSEMGKEVEEMERHGKRTFCCGAGGSNYWYQVPQQQSMADVRTEEAAATGASTLVTECPFCLAMFEDSARVSGAKVSVKDIAEIVADELSPETSEDGRKGGS